MLLFLSRSLFLESISSLPALILSLTDDLVDGFSSKINIVDDFAPTKVNTISA